MTDILNEAYGVVQCKECPWYKSCVMPMRFNRRKTSAVNSSRKFPAALRHAERCRFAEPFIQYGHIRPELAAGRMPYFRRAPAQQSGISGRH